MVCRSLIVFLANHVRRQLRLTPAALVSTPPRGDRHNFPKKTPGSPRIPQGRQRQRRCEASALPLLLLLLPLRPQPTLPQSGAGGPFPRAYANIPFSNQSRMTPHANFILPRTPPVNPRRIPIRRRRVNTLNKGHSGSRLRRQGANELRGPTNRNLAKNP